jgi:hypothetical protein
VRHDVVARSPKSEDRSFAQFGLDAYVSAVAKENLPDGPKAHTISVVPLGRHPEFEESFQNCRYVGGN